eukprot:TRINITY_DN7691_c0_g1_i1.p2 TRINITY_DN7691_c0_g1~~TRINITY_DN7691_c0_g1_i1.p2  ORF type:complete len:508 (+),score=176.39 TRINITY_DN7691_c0_g1_i1:123-1646(+)
MGCHASVAAAAAAAAAAVEAAPVAVEWGWREDPAAEDALAGCDFASVDMETLTAESFEADLRHRAPVVLRGSHSLELLAQDTATKVATAELLESAAPGLRVRSRGADSVEGRVMRSERRSRPLGELVRHLGELNESALEFSAEGGPSFADLLRSARRGWPDSALATAFDIEDASTLGIWPPWGGAPLHAHEETYFALLHGAKLWLLWPPGALERLASLPDALWPLQAKPGVLLGLLEGLPAAARPRRCLQRAGEVMYLPDFWWHFTVNVGETFGFGQQKLRPPALRQLLKQHPTSCKVASAVAQRRPPSDRRAAELLQRAFSSSPWCLTIDDNARLWGAALAAANDLKQLLPAVKGVGDGLNRLARDGLVNAQQAAKDLRHTARQLLDLAFPPDGAQPPAGAAELLLPPCSTLLQRAVALSAAGEGRRDPHALAELAFVRTQQGRYQAAIQLSEEALGLLPEAERPLAEDLQDMRERLEEALPALRKAAAAASATRRPAEGDLDDEL